MKRKLNLKAVAGAFVVALIVGGMIAQLAGFNAGIVGFAIAFALPFFTVRPEHARGASVAGVQKEIWQDHIEGNLFKNNEFLLASTDASHYVVQGKLVHIPIIGSPATVEINRSTFPASATQRTDTDITYALDEYSTDPILIPNAEAYELSYSKRESILGEHESALREVLADNLLINWSPEVATGGLVLRTTGSSATSHLAGTSGTRKTLLVSDVKRAQLHLDRQNVPMEGRYALISADMFSQLTDDMSATEYRDFSAAYDAKNGVVGRLFGFNIMVRSTVVSYDLAATAANTYGALAADDDNDAMLCWQVSALERAVGQVTFFENVGDPTYYGDVYSVSVRVGGRKRRLDEKGVLAIVQEA
jgi:hypothetical protein